MKKYISLFFVVLVFATLYGCSKESKEQHQENMVNTDEATMNDSDESDKHIDIAIEENSVEEESVEKESVEKNSNEEEQSEINILNEFKNLCDSKKYLGDINFKNDIVKELVEEDYYLPVVDSIQLDTGIITAMINDFDGDGQLELLTLEVNDEHAIEYNIYEYYENSVEKTASQTLYQDEFATQDLFCSFFIKSVDDVRYFCFESGTSGPLISDGYAWEFRALKYSDSSFEEVLGLQCDGSSVEDEEINKLIRQVREFGIDVESIFDRDKITEQDKEIVNLADISITCEISYELLNDFWDSDELKIDSIIDFSIKNHLDMEKGTR